MKKQKHVKLTPETVTDDLIGFGVTIGLRDAESTHSGIIESFTPDGMNISVGNKTKFFPWQPENIVLKVYQFDLGIHLVPESDLMEQGEPTEKANKSPEQKPTKKQQIIWS